MMRLVTRYLKRISIDFLQRWNQIWFTPRSTFDVGLARIAIGGMVAVYAMNWLFVLHGWIDETGALNRTTTRFLIGDQLEGTGSIGRISLLYQFDSLAWTQGYLVVTIIGALIVMAGIGGRFLVALTWLLALGIAHRIPILQGPGEMLLTGIMGYLVIDPGKAMWKRVTGANIREARKVPEHWLRAIVSDSADRWSATLGLRLMQAHLLVWLGISLLSHLAEPMWWSGSAVWWLAAGHRSPFLSQSFLVDRPYLVNGLTHGFIALHFVTILLFVVRGCRPLANAATLLLAMSIWILAGDWFYGLVLCGAAACFWGIAIRELSTPTAVVGNSNPQSAARTGKRR